MESPEYFNHDGDSTITDLGLSGFCNNNYYEFDPPPVQILIDRNGDYNVRRLNDR